MNASKKFALVAAIAAGGFLAAGAAQAHADVSWSVTIGGGAPVYGAPVYDAPVYRPAPVYQPGPAVVLPAPVIGLPVPRVYVPAPPRGVYPVRYDRDHDGIPDRYDRYDNRRHGWERDGRRWDSDGDGVPNRYDRNDHNPRRW